MFWRWRGGGIWIQSGAVNWSKGVTTVVAFGARVDGGLVSEVIGSLGLQKCVFSNIGNLNPPFILAKTDWFVAVILLTLYFG